MSDKLEQLKTILAEVTDLGRAAALLEWDQETYMPPGGVGARSDQLSTLTGLAHARFTTDDVGRLLGELEEGFGVVGVRGDIQTVKRVGAARITKDVRRPGVQQQAIVGRETRAVALRVRERCFERRVGRRCKCRDHSVQKRQCQGRTHSSQKCAAF